MPHGTSVLTAIFLLASAAGAALAQAPAQPAAPPPKQLPVPADPAQTTASYGDWILRCVRTGENAGGPRSCEVVQTLVMQGQQQPVAQIAIGSIDKELRLTVVVPTAISLTTVPRVTAPNGPTLVNLVWRRCLPNGCFADNGLNAEAVKTLRARTEPMQLSLKDAGERDLNLPFSLRGLTAALDALAKETAAR